MRKHYSTLELHKILADADFENFARTETRWEGHHLRVILAVNDSNVIDKLTVFELSAKLRKIDCRCVVDDGRQKSVRCSLALIGFIVCIMSLAIMWR